MKNEHLKLYEIDKDYLCFLHSVDYRVSLEHLNANTRKFLGVVCEINNIKYYAPLGSPKEKHKTMHECIDLYKIKNGELGVINFNNMIPVSDDVVNMFELSTTLKENDPKYYNVMLEQLRIFSNDEESIKIRKKAKKLYNMRYKPYLNDKIKSRCCDWHTLEAAMKIRRASTIKRADGQIVEVDADRQSAANKALEITITAGTLPNIAKSELASVLQEAAVETQVEPTIEKKPSKFVRYMQEAAKDPKNNTIEKVIESVVHVLAKEKVDRAGILKALKTCKDTDVQRIGHQALKRLDIQQRQKHSVASR